MDGLLVSIETNWFKGHLQVKTRKVILRHQEGEESPKHPENADFLKGRAFGGLCVIGVLI